MADIKITSADGLVTATIKEKQETYYLVTEDNISSLRQKSLLADLFIFLSSLSWGAYISVIITIKSIPPENLSNDHTKSIVTPLDTLNIVFLSSSILFTLLSILFAVISFRQGLNLKQAKLETK